MSADLYSNYADLISPLDGPSKTTLNWLPHMLKFHHLQSFDDLSILPNQTKWAEILQQSTFILLFELKFDEILVILNRGLDLKIFIFGI